MNLRQYPEYSVWATMKTRCQNAKHPTYANYGAKGISICDRWQSFCSFLEDMGPRPEGYTLERVDSRGNYEPSNCRWATRRDQNNNRSNNRIVEYRGQKMPLGRAIEVSGSLLDWGTVISRLKSGWDLERALFEPKISASDAFRRMKLGYLKHLENLRQS